MLRTVMHPHPQPYLIAGGVTPTSSSTVTIQAGNNDIETVAHVGAGIAKITWKQATNYTGSYFEAPVIGSTRQTSGTASFVGTATAKTTISVSQAAGTNDIPLDFMAFTYKDRQLRDDSLLVPVRCNFKGAFLQAGKVVNNAIAIGTRAFSLTVNGTGDYTITFREAFGSLPVVAFGNLTSSRRISLHSKTASSIRVRCTNLSNVANNTNFYFMALGVRSYFRQTGGQGPEGGAYSELQTHYRKPRLLVFTAKDTGFFFGAASASNFLNNATGNNQFNIAKPFKQEPIVCGNAYGAGIGASTFQVASAQKDFIQYYNLNSSGVGQDRFSCLFVLGSDDASTYEA